MATVYPDSIVDRFVVNDGHVANPVSSFQVRGVYPPGFVASVCGEALCGDGHVSFGAPSGQFGTVTISTSSPQSRTVTGLGSVQLFGVPVVKATIARSIGSVASVQAFGTVRFRVSAPTGGVPSAQQFGVPTAKAGAISRSVAAVASAASFGTITAKSVFVRTVSGLDSAQTFGVPTSKASIRISPTGLGSAQLFGAPTVKAVVTRTLVGLGSAQAFGSIIAAVPKSVGGVGSVAAFGVPQAKYRVQPPGLGSAQAFGTPTIPQRVRVPGVQGSSAYTTSIVETFKVDDGHVVSGESDLSYFGKPFVGHLWLLGSDCVDSPAPAICGVLCGLTVCGGESFLDLGVCITDEAFLDAGYASTIIDQLQVDDGHVVDGQLDNCLDSPFPAICDPGTICGSVVCGGTSYISELECLFYDPPITVTRTIDLQHVECL